MVLTVALAPLANAAPVTVPAAPEVTVLLDDLPVAFPVPPFLDGDTTMVPLRALGEALGFEIRWTDSESPIRCVKDAVTISVRLGESDVCVGDRETSMPRPAQLRDGTTVVPLRFFSETLGYRVSWDEESSTATARSAKSAMEIWGFYALGSQSYSSWDDLFGQKYPFPLTPLSSSPASKTAGAILGWFAVNSDGLIMSGGHPSGYAKPDGWEAVMMRLASFGAKRTAMFFADNRDGVLSSLLADEGTRERLAVNISLASVGFDGIALDFEGLGAGEDTREKDAANFTSFVESMKRHSADRSVSLVLPPLNSVYKGYDHRELGRVSDTIILMAYGYEDPTDPSPTAPWDRVDEAIRLETEIVPKDKVILGIPAYGTVYKEVAQAISLEARPAARERVGPDDAAAAWSPPHVSEVVEWQDADGRHLAYLESNRTLQARISLAARHGLRGVAIWRLGLLQTDWWDAVLTVTDPVR